jgi:hypothetical protein
MSISHLFCMAWPMMVLSCSIAQAGDGTAKTFPPIDGTGQYTITVDVAKGLSVDTLSLPDNFILKVAPGVTEVEWWVTHIVVGANVTIDLSVPQQYIQWKTIFKNPDGSPYQPIFPIPAGPPGTRGADTLGQAEYCQPGAGGGAGGKGSDGLNGVSFTLHNVKSMSVESLWINTSGGAGSSGGQGGHGQTGGGHRSQWVPGSLHSCDAADGGPGGAGGAGGKGGDSATVALIDSQVKFPAPNCPAECTAPASRPPSAKGNSKIIVIYGTVGCGGNGGLGGSGGGPVSNAQSWGATGPTGAQGANGICAN